MEIVEGGSNVTFCPSGAHGGNGGSRVTSSYYYGVPGQGPTENDKRYMEDLRRKTRRRERAQERAEIRRKQKEWDEGQFWWKLRVHSIVRTSKDGAFTNKHRGKYPLFLKPLIWAFTVLPWGFLGLAIEVIIPEIFWRNSNRQIPIEAPKTYPDARGGYQPRPRRPARK